MTTEADVWYVDYDDESALWCVFHVDKAKASASFSDRTEAEKDASERNSWAKALDLNRKMYPPGS